MEPYTNPGGINAACETSIKVFQCPSDPAPPLFTQVNGLTYPGNNYRGNQGVVAPASTSNGVFYDRSQVKIADITDGTSQTALFSEKLRGAGQLNPRTTLFLMPSHQPALTSVLQTCQGLDPSMAMPLCYDMGVCWAMGEESCTLYDHVSGPNTLSCQGMVSFTGGGISRSVDNPPSSGHTNGVNVLFCDGSVHFINNAVTLPVWWALGTRNGGEAINGDY